MSSKYVLTKTSSHDDGKFVRTALVVGDDTSGGASVDILHAETGKLLARLNFFTNAEGDWFAADVIDVEESFTTHRAIAFLNGQRATLDAGKLVGADFRKEQ